MNELGKFFEDRPKWAAAFVVLVILAFLVGWGSLRIIWKGERVIPS